MKKILIVSTVARQFYLFEKNNIKILEGLGFEIHGAANFNDENERLKSLNIVRHHISIARSPFSIRNFVAIFQVVKLIKKYDFDAVHCHSPMGGVVGRIASKLAGLKSVIYTAHGFHFYRGAPIIKWLLFYPVEKILSVFTHTLITINMEDYACAKTFYAKDLVLVPGIGINTKPTMNDNVEYDSLRCRLGIDKNDIVIISVGELIDRKNQITALKALSTLKNFSFKYLICGKGTLLNTLKEKTIELGLDSKVSFLGFRNDIIDLCFLADIFLFPSKQEGLPVSLMEAMVAGLPVVCSNIRGNSDLIDDGKGGYLHDVYDVNGISNSLMNLMTDDNLRMKFGEFNLERIKAFDEENVNKIMYEIYRKL